MTENDRRILAKACGVCWHDYKIGDGFVSTCSCGRRGCIVREFCGSANPTFSVPDDWELVRVKIIAGPNVGAFHQWLIDHKSWLGSGFEWWLMRTPEQCCQLVCNWIKARPDLFPWVGEMEE